MIHLYGHTAVAHQHVVCTHDHPPPSDHTARTQCVQWWYSDLRPCLQKLDGHPPSNPQTRLSESYPGGTPERKIGSHTKKAKK